MNLFNEMLVTQTPRAIYRAGHVSDLPVIKDEKWGNDSQ